MKLTLRPKKSDNRGWPGYILGGRMRTSTLGLIVAFFVTAWLYDTYQPPPAPAPLPATQVVPPGYVPDPEYTWVPRTSVREYPTTTVPRTTTPTTTTTTTTEAPPTTTEPSPTTTTPTTTTPQNPFLPTPPTPQTTPTTAAPEPGPPPVPPVPGF